MFLITAPIVNELNNDTLCLNNPKSFNVSAFNNGNGPFTYLWNNGSAGTTFSINPVTVDTLVWVEVSDKYNCKGRDSAFVKVLTALPVKISGLPDSVICEGESLTLSSQYLSTNGYLFDWNTGETTQSITVDSAGVYQLDVVDANSCSGSDIIVVVVNPLPDLSSIPDSAWFCEGGQAQIGANLGANYDYLWAQGGSTNPIYTALLDGTYLLTVSNILNSCEQNKNIVVVENSNPTINLGNDINYCAGESIVLSTSNANSTWTYLWNNFSTQSSLIVSNSGEYRLSVTDTNNCVDSDTIQVNFNAFPILDLAEGKDSLVLCEGESINLSAGSFSAGHTFLWSTGESNSTILIDESGIYSLMVANQNCSAHDTVTVVSVNLPQNVLQDTAGTLSLVYCMDEQKTVTLSATYNNPFPMDYSYLWNTGESSSVITIKEAGDYSVVVSKDHCETKSEISVIDYCPSSIFIPNGFTPNEDGLNEEFKPIGKYLNHYEMFIYNRWGELIFTSTDINQGWDGTYLGKPVQMDVYVWKVNYSYNKESGLEKRKQQIGTVTLVD